MVGDAAADAEDRHPNAALFFKTQRGLRAVMRPAGDQLAAELDALTLIEREPEEIDGLAVGVRRRGALLREGRGSAEKE